MITYVIGDLLQSPAKVFVNTVNTVGVMGKGIAKDFKFIYPEMFVQYRDLCDKKQFDVGDLWLYKTKHKWVLNFPTKKSWRQPSRLEYIEAGLKKFGSTYADEGMTSVAFPMLGCGHGGLDWEDEVRPLMEKYLKNLPIDIYIYLYQKDPFQSEQKNIREIKKWLRSEPKSLSFSKVWEDLEHLLDQRSSFFTLDTKVEFTAQIISQPESGIELRVEGKLFHFYFDQFVDLWQHIHHFGYFMSGIVPQPLEQYTPYLLSVFEKLPYLKPVLIASSYQDMSKNPIGLQYISGID